MIKKFLIPITILFLQNQLKAENATETKDPINQDELVTNEEMQE